MIIFHNPATSQDVGVILWKQLLGSIKVQLFVSWKLV